VFVFVFVLLRLKQVYRGFWLIGDKGITWDLIYYKLLDMIISLDNGLVLVNLVNPGGKGNSFVFISNLVKEGKGNLGF
jgi:hypothetical protein